MFSIREGEREAGVFPLASQIKKVVIRSGALCGVVLSSLSMAEPLPGGTLDPLTIPKYVTPMSLPLEMPESKSDKKVDYQIAVRQFEQQVLPQGFPQTTVWGYGSIDHPASFAYPAYTIEAEANHKVKVKWINELIDAQGNYLPHLFPVDQTLHWANPTGQSCSDGTARSDCSGTNPVPYTGPVPMVTHVHGAHVGPESDGYPEAWWLPAAANIPPDYITRGSRWGQSSKFSVNDGQAVFTYPNDQSEATLWYHDHSLGITRLNVYAGPAGFWLIRDEKGLERKLDLPRPAPKKKNKAGRKYYELPLVIQDRSFNADGSLFYPSERAFFEGIEPGQLDIDFVPNSDIAPQWNPEAFFNVMVVNGATWPYYDVDQGRYRLRLLNACNSRFLNLSLQVVSSPDASLVGSEIPFYQIGNDQGLLSDVVRVQTGVYTIYDTEDAAQPVKEVTPPDPQQALLMAPAERADVIVDFTGLPAGTRVRVINTAPDAPFGGFPDVPADADTSGQVMEFVVGVDVGPVFADPTAMVLPDAQPLVADAPVRHVSLNEEESETVCVTAADDGSISQLRDVLPGENFGADCAAAGGEAFAPKAAKLGTMGNTGGMPMMWGDAVTENPALNTTEEWAIHNLTEDAHPIHLHLVKFQVVSRELPDGTPSDAGLQPWEDGFKDTVIAYPGEVTRIRALFDVAGLYVWHCHILEHEDNEMMRPMCVGDASGDCQL